MRLRLLAPAPVVISWRSLLLLLMLMLHLLLRLLVELMVEVWLLGLVVELLSVPSMLLLALLLASFVVFLKSVALLPPLLLLLALGWMLLRPRLLAWWSSHSSWVKLLRIFPSELCLHLLRMLLLLLLHELLGEGVVPSIPTSHGKEVVVVVVVGVVGRDASTATALVE